ncbi:hypothetical protein JG620_02095 [Devosia sp. MC521]|nr:hypothetical protein [Devosia sp. MC521]
MLSDSTISTAGSHSYGIAATSGAQFVAEKVGITTSDDGADGVLAQNTGTEITLRNLDIVTQGPSARGIRVLDGAFVSAEQIAIVTEGSGASEAIRVENGSEMTLVDADISVLGSDSWGILVDTSVFDASGIQIATDGANATGVDVYGAGAWGGGGLGSGTIETKGSNSYGAGAGAGAELSMEHFTITTSGGGAVGVYAWGAGSLVDLRAVTVETQGSASYSLEAQLAGKIQAFGGTFTTSGASAHGIAAFDGGVVEASNVDIAVTGTDASAIAIWNVSAADTNSVTINGGSLSASAAPVMLVDGGTGTIALNGAIDIVAPTSTPRSVLLAVKESSVGSSDVDVTLTDVTRVHGDIDVTGAGNVLNATIDGSEWIGDLFADSNNTANIALKGARWTGMATNASTVSLNPSVWTITGDSNAAYVDNAGELRFDPAAAGFPILVARDYFGRDGRLRLNTQLDGDGSPSNLLVIDGGTATGKTTVSINNAGGSGQQTIGDGILVIDTRAGGMTARDAFALGGRVAAGAYEYVLQRGSLTGGDDDDWFLRSHVPIAAQADIPLYRPEVPLYAPITDLSRRMGMTLVGTLHERVGEQAGMGPSSDARLMNAVWTRAIVEGGRAQWGGELNVNAEDVHLLGLQTGVDIYRGEHEDGRRDHIGVYGALAASKAQVSGYALGAS